jgi:hypothetical protein
MRSEMAKSKRKRKRGESSNEEDEEDDEMCSSADEADLNKLRNPKFKNRFSKIPSDVSEDQLKFFKYQV